MYAHSNENQDTDAMVIDLCELTLDLKRVLSIQFREFIHHIEDAQGEHSLEHNPRVITFLENCYKAA